MRSTLVKVPSFSPQPAAGSTTSARRRSRSGTCPGRRRTTRAGAGSRGCAPGRAATRPGWSPRSTASRWSPARRSARSTWRGSAATSGGCRRDRPATAPPARGCAQGCPSCGARQVAVGAGLAGVLRRRLPVHLVDAGAGAPDHAPKQVDVVHGARGRGRLVRLVEALEDGREQPLGAAEEVGRAAQVVPGHAADLRRAGERARLDGRAEIVEAERMGVDPRAVDPVAHDQLARQGVHQHEVGADPRREVDVGLAGDRGGPRVDGDHGRRVGPRRRSSMRDQRTVWVSATLWPHSAIASQWSTSS